MDKFPVPMGGRPPAQKLDPKALMAKMGHTIESPEQPSTSAPAPKNFTPIDPLSPEYFDSETTVALPSRGLNVHVLLAGPPPGTPRCPVVLCVHGGGYSAATWGPTVKRLKHKYRFVCPDMRGHGLTRPASPDASLELEIGQLVEDLIAFVEAFLGEEKPSLMLVGHSLGGAVAARAAASKRIPKLEATAVIDVVEGTALASLPYIMQVLTNRPSSFATLEEAVAWALKSKMTHCEESARVSVPRMLEKREGAAAWTWITPLARSESHWEGWYRVRSFFYAPLFLDSISNQPHFDFENAIRNLQGMSEVFLQMPGYKLLALAGTDRLDKTLTMGQMQGKFQMQVFAHSGHPIQEDCPGEFAEKLDAFLTHFKIGQPLVIPKWTPPPPVHDEDAPESIP